jgi:hypothetical protein
MIREIREMHCERRSAPLLRLGLSWTDTSRRPEGRVISCARVRRRLRPQPQPEANEEDASALANAIVSGESSSSAGAVRRARTAEADRRDEAAAAKTAYDRLRVDVSGIAAEVERAERAVDSAVGNVLQPTARRLLDEAKSLRLEFLKRVYAVDTMRPLLPPGFEEEKQRLLTFIAPELMAASRVVQQDWRAVIEALKADSDAPLPG